MQEFRSSLTEFVAIGQQIEKGRGHGQRGSAGAEPSLSPGLGLIKERNQLFPQDVWLGQESGEHGADEGEGRHPALTQSILCIPTGALYCPLSLLTGRAL